MYIIGTQVIMFFIHPMQERVIGYGMIGQITLKSTDRQNHILIVEITSIQTHKMASGDRVGFLTIRTPQAIGSQSVALVRDLIKMAKGHALQIIAVTNWNKPLVIFGVAGVLLRPLQNSQDGANF
jgi:hypothetical protein